MNEHREFYSIEGSDIGRLYLSPTASIGSSNCLISSARAGPTALANILIQVKTVESTIKLLAFLQQDVKTIVDSSKCYYRN